jgi:DNA-binding transcriptional LysR family regulator
MDLHHLKTFVVVADEHSFTKAATRLNISQPPLSRHVRDLEAQLGVRLLSRDHQRVELTPKGATLLPKAKIVLDSFEQFMTTAERLRLEDATVTVGLTPALWEVIATVQAPFKGRHPDLGLAVKEVRTQLWPDTLQAGTADVGIVRGFVNARECHCQKLFDERLIVLLPATHRLAGAGSVKLSDLRNDPIITTKGLAWAYCLKLFRRARFKPSEIVEIPFDIDRSSFRLLITSGRGIYFHGSSLWTSPIGYQGMSPVRLEERNASWPVTMVWRKNETSRAVLDFVDTTLQVFRDACADARAAKPRKARPVQR